MNKTMIWLFPLARVLSLVPLRVCVCVLDDGQPVFGEEIDEKPRFLGVEVATLKKIIIPLGMMMFFCILFNYTILRGLRMFKMQTVVDLLDLVGRGPCDDLDSLFSSFISSSPLAKSGSFMRIVCH